MVLPAKESIRVEFKSDRNRLSDHDLVEAAVALANTAGGQIFLGVEDDGTATGLHKEHQEYQGIVALIANHTIPPVSVFAERINMGDVDIVCIDVPRSSGIVATKSGKVLRRRQKLDGSPENTPMYPFEYESHLSSLGRLDFSEKVVFYSSPEDLDPNERVRLRRMIKTNNGEATLLDLSDEELDRALRLVKEVEGVLYPTITGLLLIGTEASLQKHLPTSGSSFQVLMDEEVKVNVDYRGSLLATLEDMEQRFSAWNPETELERGLIRQRIPEFSHRAFREGLVNAFVHRDYTILKRVIVQINDAGLNLTSPGGFIEGISLRNLLTIEPHGRNPVLADACKRIGLAERTGRGVDRIFQGSLMYGRPLPDYSESSSEAVRLFISRAKPNLAFIQMLFDYEHKKGRALSVYALMILAALLNERRLNIQQLTEKSLLSSSRVKPTVERLIEDGLIERRGEGRATCYILSHQAYEYEKNAQAYVRQSLIDSVRYPELILNLAKAKHGQITRADVVDLLHVTDPQAYRLLKQLVERDALVLSGKGRGARYLLAK